MWALAFACAVSFMGIGLVDPILPAISRELDASPTQTMLLFTSYLLIRERGQKVGVLGAGRYSDARRVSI